MPKFQPRWTDEQKQAVLDACIRYGLSTEKATYAANEGRLPGSWQHLEPFPIALSTVRNILTQHNRQARQARAVTESPEDAIRREAGRLVADLENTRRAMLPKGTKHLTPAQVTELAKANREVLALIRALGKTSAGAGKHVDTALPEKAAQEPVETPEPDFLDQLATNGNRSPQNRT